MANACTLTSALRGRWYGRYGLACCPAHDDHKPSLTLADAADGRLLLSCKSGCSFQDVLSALHTLGLADRRTRSQLPSASEIARRRKEDEAAAAKRERQAIACWTEALPIHGTLAEAYLRARGITCPLPGTLRFHPACWHVSAQRLPAMVARVDGLPRLSVHRTYLREDGAGKAAVDPPKAMLGATRGGAVCVQDHPGLLVVAEGIETALSLASGLLPTPATVCAALSTSGMARLRLPQQPHHLLIAADGDAAGLAAAEELAQRAAAQGWTVELKSAPNGRDFNDVLLEGRKPSWR